MAILKIKDADGRVYEIPALKGNKGDSYVLTEEDKAEIVDSLAAEIITQEVEQSYYYTTLSDAITDIESDTTDNAITDVDEAYVKVFVACDGTKTVMLLKDFSETAQIQVTKNIDINLGGYTLTFDSVNAYIKIGSECAQLSNGTISVDITNGVPYSSLIEADGSKLTVDNITLDVHGGVSSSYAGFYFSNTDGVYTIKNSNISVSNSLSMTCAIHHRKGLLTIENSVINANTDSATMSVGVVNYDRLYIIDSVVFADAPDNSVDRNGYSQGIQNAGTLYSINTDVRGTHSGAESKGSLYISGGVYNSCAHGGLYLSTNGQGETFVKDAIISCTDYTGIHDSSAFSNAKLSALYLGTSSNSNGEVAYFDGCTIDATDCNHVLALRDSEGDDINICNISNSTISAGTNRIRMDGTTVKLNIGEGTNITTDRLPSGANYEYTDEIYRKFGNNEDVNGKDINLVLATCATKNELDKIPNQVISILENNAIEQIPAKNLFNKDDYKSLVAYINSTGKILTSSSEATTVYIPVEANQVYTVSKIASKRFAVGVTDSETLANGTTFTETIQQNALTSITITTGANSKNLAVFCHITSADTLTVDEILDTLQIEKGNTATEYEAWYEPTYNAVDMTAREKADGLIGTPDDESSADTIYGAKAYARELVGCESSIITQEGSIIALQNTTSENITVTCSNSTLEDISTETIISCGKNLLKNTASNKTSQGITFTKNDEGVTVVGTATANSFYYPNENFYLPAGNYHLSGCPNGGSSSTYYLSVQKVENETTSLIGRDFGNGLDFTVPENVTLKVFIGITSGQTVDLNFKPMIELASIATDEYEPYMETIYSVDNAGNVSDVVFNPPITILYGSTENTILTVISGQQETCIDILRGWREAAYGKIDNLFEQATAAPIITFIDDDTTDLAAVQRFKNTCDELGIVGGFAVVTSNLDSQPELAEALQEYEKEGFHMCLHCDVHNRFYAPATRDYAQCRSDFVTGIRKMKKYQFADPMFWCIPYGSPDKEMEDMAKKWGMECLVASGCNSYETAEAKNGRFALRRCSLDPTDDGALTTLERLKTLVRMTVAENGWLLITTHFTEDGWVDNQDRFKELVNYALEQGMQVKTLNEAYRIREPIYRLYETF